MAPINVVIDSKSFSISNSNYQLDVNIQNGVSVQQLINKRARTALVNSAGGPQPLVSIEIETNGTRKHFDSRDFVVTETRREDDGLTIVALAAIDTGENLTVTMHLEFDDRPYLRCWVELAAEIGKALTIVAVDWLPVKLQPAMVTWQHPDYQYPLSPRIYTPWQLSMGQPVYAAGFYLGCEFPATNNRIDHDTIQIQNYSGRQLTVNQPFISKKFVIGAAASDDLAIVRQDFFNYIDDIAQPIQFRIQYNSWYDHDMGITQETIQNAFSSFHEKATQYRLPKIDAYVLDDGWNNYNTAEFDLLDVVRSGKTYNRTGFWEINDKFGFDLSSISALTAQMGAKFGLWFGPQGGYKLYRPFAQYLQLRGTGYVDNSMATPGVIDTGDRHYIRLTTERLLDYQRRYDIDYWKMDGFATRASQELGHNHLVGGPYDMYFHTEYWENWLNLFTELRKARLQEGKGLFINATSFVPLSPWMLQWANSVWLQNSEDDSLLGTGSPADQRINGRDQRYFDLFKTGGLQFPLDRLYNHEPIYGVSAQNVEMSDAEFAKYLYWNIFRGPHFMELHYSPKILTPEKWRVTRNVLQFAKEHQHQLRNVALLGDDPQSDIYGYWTHMDSEGFVALRNATGADHTLILPANLARHIQNETVTELITVGGPAKIITDRITLPAHTLVVLALGQSMQLGSVETVAAEGSALKITFNRPFNPIHGVQWHGQDLAVLKSNLDRSTFWVEKPATPIAGQQLKVVGQDPADQLTLSMAVDGSEERYYTAPPSYKKFKIQFLVPSALSTGETVLVVSRRVKLVARNNSLILVVDGHDYPVQRTVHLLVQDESGTYGGVDYQAQQVTARHDEVLMPGENFTMNLIFTPTVIEVWLDGQCRQVGWRGGEALLGTHLEPGNDTSHVVIEEV